MRQNMISARIVATTKSQTRSARRSCQLKIDCERCSDARSGNDNDRPGSGHTECACYIGSCTRGCHIDDHHPTFHRSQSGLEDLPVLAQCFLESCNRGSDKQIGSVRREALDLLALYRWPGELDELRSVVTAAHRACSSHEIGPADLPPVIHHAAQAASPLAKAGRADRARRVARHDRKGSHCTCLGPGRRGNKTEAAELLGMTRPRLYRRLVQLGISRRADV